MLLILYHLLLLLTVPYLVVILEVLMMSLSALGGRVDTSFPAAKIVQLF